MYRFTPGLGSCILHAPLPLGTAFVINITKECGLHYFLDRLKLGGCDLA
jgi:hypothetical protein